MLRSPNPPSLLRGSALAAATLLLFLGACHDSNSSPPPAGIAPEPNVPADGVLPGVVVTIEEVRGRTPGHADVGDLLTVDFKITTDAGEPLELSTMARASIMVSGPTSNYQRVIASQSDVVARATKRDVGAYTYQFAVAIPDKYLAPLNDTSALSEGELTDQPLIDGTYTVGLEIRKDYTIDGVLYRDPGNATRNFLLGEATTLEPREVVLLANCNKCHTELRAHGDNRNQITNCLLCHTAGAEDKNDASVAGGTPGVGIDFKVMIHKIHSGKHLPSVLGMTTNPDGSRNYGATPKPYQIMGYGNSLIDFSTVTWPAWPSFYTPMPRDLGYSTLTSAQRSAEDTMRRGPSECNECHGDPDGAGPLGAPLQGDTIWTKPTITTCTSCHDDWEPSHAYTANGSTMPPQADSAACTQCHREAGTPLDLIDAHRHPLVDPTVAQGVVFEVASVTDIGNGNGRFEAGEKVEVTFSAKNNDGAVIQASSLSRIETLLTGPTVNPQLLNYQRIPTDLFVGDGPYTFRLPEIVFYESIGVSDVHLNTFGSSRAPHWNRTGAATTVLRVTGTGGTTTLLAEARAAQNFLDVQVGGGANFANGDYILVDDANAGAREFLRVQMVQGDRLWFGSMYKTTYKAGLSHDHAIGATVTKVTTTSVSASLYNLDALTGVFTETAEIGDGELLATYTTDFEIPTVYPGSINNTATNGEDWGDWTGLPLLDGTYTFDLHGARSLSVTRATETTTYTEGADSTVTQLLFGSATEIVEVPRADPQSCYGCHNSLQFHGGSRRSLETCLSCHSTAGMEGRPLYEGGSAVGESVEFRHWLHAAHKEVFPAMPGGVQDCAKCHGDNTVWQLPAERRHPLQNIMTRSWMVACSSCHTDSAALAHMDVNTTMFGAESCAICHGTDDERSVINVHKIK